MRRTLMLKRIRYALHKFGFPITNVCVRCGHPRAAHITVNYANGTTFSADVLVCPTSIFST